MADELPVIVAEWDKNARELVRVSLDEYHGNRIVDCRVWYRDGNDRRPTKSGLTISVKHLPALAAGLAAALDRAREMGLIEPEAGQ